MRLYCQICAFGLFLQDILAFRGRRSWASLTQHSVLSLETVNCFQRIYGSYKSINRTVLAKFHFKVSTYYLKGSARHLVFCLLYLSNLPKPVSHCHNPADDRALKMILCMFSQGISVPKGWVVLAATGTLFTWCLLMCLPSALPMLLTPICTNISECFCWSHTCY